MGDRLQRILQKQQEREAKLRDAELKLAQQKKVEQEEKMKKKQEDMKQLQNKHDKWLEKDVLIIGYRGADSWSSSVDMVPERNLVDIKQIEVQRKVDGTTSGLQWVRTPYGWQRGHDPNQNYKSPCSVTSLPSWLYDELDIYFGLRRPATSDFVDACIILQQLYNRYIDSPDTSMSVRRRLLTDASIAISRLHKCPEFLRCNNFYLKARDAITPLRDDIQQKVVYGGFELPLSESILTVSDAIDDTVDCRSLCYASSICYLWGLLANEDILYQQLLQRHFHGTKVPKHLSNKDVFINKWTRKETMRVGIMSCTWCNVFYWASKPGHHSCEKSINTYKKNYGHRVACKDILNLLIGRVKHY